MNPVEPLAAPQRQHLRYLLEQGLPLASRPYRVLAER
ncbi:AsnC family protein, partial [Pseudomonas aeruginosa]